MTTFDTIEEVQETLNNLKRKTSGMLKLSNLSWNNLKVYCEIWDVDMVLFEDCFKTADKQSVVVELRKQMRKYENNQKLIEKGK